VNSQKHCSPDNRVTDGLPNHNSDYGTRTVQLVAVLLTGCITMVKFPAKLKIFLFATKTKPVWGLTSSPTQRDTSPVQGRWSINMTTCFSLVPRLGIPMLYLNIFSCHDMMFKHTGQFYKQSCLCVAKLPWLLKKMLYSPTALTVWMTCQLLTITVQWRHFNIL